MERILNYELTLEVLGPLFIGNGEEIKKSEYIHNIRDNKIYVMNPLKMFKGLKELNLLKDYEKAIIKEPKGFNLYNFIRDYKINLNDYKNWAEYSFDVDPKSDFRKSNILPFIKDAYNMPYVPGSSIKGAIRNAFLNVAFLDASLLGFNDFKFDDIATSIENERFTKRNQYMARQEKEIKIKVLHRANREKKDKADMLNDIFYGMRISDSRPIGLENIILCEKHDILPNGKAKKLNVQRECLKPGTKIVFDVQIDTEIFGYDEKKLCEIIKLMYNNINEVFLKKFTVRVEPKRVGDTLIYVGGGAGFLSKTMVYPIFKDSSRAVKVASVILDNTDSRQKFGKHWEDPRKYGISPHTRKCTIYNGKLYDFGLCKISFQPIE